MLSFELNNLSELPTQLTHVIAEQKKEIDLCLTQHKTPRYQALIPLLEQLENQLHLFWSPIAHLHSVKNSDALREVFEQCLPILSAYGTWMSHHQALFLAFKHIAESKEYAELSTAQKKYIADSLRDFTRAGVHLPPAEKKRFAEITQTLTALSNQFEQQLMDATEHWHYLIEDPKELMGLPENTLELLAQNAHATNQSGYLLNLQAPCFMAVITYAQDRALRRKIYEAWITRASDVGPSAGSFDNTNLMFDIVRLKNELAHLLGFSDYASYALETKMAGTPQAVDEFLKQLITLAKPFAEKEMAQLTTFAQSLDINTLEPWDIAYVSEQLKQQELHFDDEQLRPYFPLPTVLHGLFHITEQLFTLTIKPAPQLPSWHDDVQAYEIVDRNQQTVAYFYLDLYAREKKRGGAWMDDAQAYWQNPAGAIQKPICFLTCNFSPPIKGQPALLTHDDVVTLFHEFGHGLHHMLTQVDVLGLTGTHVEWDAVELPSQLLENWCWQTECLHFLSAHYQSHQPLSYELIEQLLKSKNFLSGLFLMRQLEFALFDLRLHWHFDSSKGAQQIQSTLDEVRKAVSVLPISPLNRFQHSFAHIFAGGYSAGYYSYLWAEVLAADAFSFFETEGILNPKAGAHWHQTVLAQGGTEPAAVLFKNFRGRAPEISALLKSYGLSSHN